MPKVTIVKADNAVLVEGAALDVDCADLPSYFHAIQWDGTTGHIEFAPDAEGRRLPNLPLPSINPYMFLVERWNQKRAVIEEQRIADEKEKKDKEEQRVAEAVTTETRRSKKRK